MEISKVNWKLEMCLVTLNAKLTAQKKRDLGNKAMLKASN